MSRLPTVGLSLASPNAKSKRWSKQAPLDVRKRKTLELPPPPMPPVVKTRSRSLVEQRPQVISPQPTTSFYIGERVAVDSMGIVGTLQFLGEAEFKEGVWAGIQLDIPGTGKNDGSVKGVRYFSCPPQTGLFVLSSKLSSLDSLSTPSLSPAHSQRITSPDRGIPSPAMTPTHPEEEDLPGPDRRKALERQLERLELENKDLRQSDHQHSELAQQLQLALDQHSRHVAQLEESIQNHRQEHAAITQQLETHWEAKLELAHQEHAQALAHSQGELAQAQETHRSLESSLAAAQRELKQQQFFPSESLQHDIDQAQLEEQIVALQDAAHAKDIFLATLSEQVELHRSAVEEKERALAEAHQALGALKKETSETIEELKRAGLESLELYESSVQVHRLERDALLAHEPQRQQALLRQTEAEQALQLAHEQHQLALEQKEAALQEALQQRDQALQEIDRKETALQQAIQQRDRLQQQAPAVIDPSPLKEALEQKDQSLRRALEQKERALQKVLEKDQALEQKDKALQEALQALQQKEKALQEASQANEPKENTDQPPAPEPAWAEKYQALEEAHQQTELECLKLMEEIERLDQGGDVRAIQTRHTTELRECREDGEEKVRELTRNVQKLNKDISELEGLIESKVFKEADLEEALELERKRVKKLQSEMEDLREVKAPVVLPPKHTISKETIYCELCDKEGHDVINCKADLLHPSKYGL